jgi:uncharacterized membrane protein
MTHLKLIQTGDLISGATLEDGHLLSHVSGAYYLHEALWSKVPAIIAAHGWTYSLTKQEHPLRREKLHADKFER